MGGVKDAQDTGYEVVLFRLGGKEPTKKEAVGWSNFSPGSDDQR